MIEHVLTLDWCCYPVGEWEIPHPPHSRSGGTVIPMCSCGWRGAPHTMRSTMPSRPGMIATWEWEKHAKPCRVVLVFCCDGDPVAPAHMHRPTPVCTCGWIGTEHHHKLGAELEWYEDHRYPEEGEEATRRHAARLTYDSFVLSGRETPAGYARTEQVQALVDKLRALRQRREEAQ